MGIRTRRAHKHAQTHFIGFGVAGFFGFMALLAVVLSLSVGTVVASWLEDLPDYSSTDAYVVAEPTRVFDVKGNEIGAFYLQKRRSVDLSQISPYVIKGTVSTEDKRFYEHNGVDPQGILRATVGQVFGRSEGASTITQQLVRNTVLSDEQFEYSLKRKVREAYIAIQLEKQYTKDQILNMYLNTVYYGHNAYGIEAASIIYLNKHANELSLAEAALLVGLPNSPSTLDPTVNPEGAKARRDLVLMRMRDAGDISQQEYDSAVAEDIHLNLGSLVESSSPYPHFVDYIRQLLQQDFSSETILKGGLKIYTTIDPTYQVPAQQALTDRIKSAGNKNIDGALVSIDNSNGHIVAMVGNSDYSNPNWGQINLATQSHRQAGSSFKTFALVAALEAGMSPTIMINSSSPMQITPSWKVQNYNNLQYGTRTLASATAISSNTAYAQIAVALGPEKIIDAARKLGIDSDLSPVPAIVLGTESVTPLEMAEAYSTIATGGIHRDPVAITKIEDRNGNIVYEHKDEPKQVLNAGIAADTIDVLRGVITGNNTGYYIARNWANNQPVAGKTGTSNKADNLWFCGFTPQITTSVWVGNPSSNTQVTYRGAIGSTQNTAQPIFTSYMNAVFRGVPRAEFPKSNEPRNYRPNDSWDLIGTPAAVNRPHVENDTEDEEEEVDPSEIEPTQKPGTNSSHQTPSKPSKPGQGGNNGETTTPEKPTPDPGTTTPTTGGN